jgi:hypothetical protein
LSEVSADVYSQRKHNSRQCRRVAFNDSLRRECHCESVSEGYRSPPSKISPSWPSGDHRERNKGHVGQVVSSISTTTPTSYFIPIRQRGRWTCSESCQGRSHFHFLVLIARLPRPCNLTPQASRPFNSLFHSIHNLSTTAHLFAISADYSQTRRAMDREPPLSLQEDDKEKAPAF